MIFKQQLHHVTLHFCRDKSMRFRLFMTRKNCFFFVDFYLNIVTSPYLWLIGANETSNEVSTASITYANGNALHIEASRVGREAWLGNCSVEVGFRVTAATDGCCGLTFGQINGCKYCFVPVHTFWIFVLNLWFECRRFFANVKRPLCHQSFEFIIYNKSYNIIIIWYMCIDRHRRHRVKRAQHTAIACRARISAPRVAGAALKAAVSHAPTRAAATLVSYRPMLVHRLPHLRFKRLPLFVSFDCWCTRNDSIHICFFFFGRRRYQRPLQLPCHPHQYHQRHCQLQYHQRPYHQLPCRRRQCRQLLYEIAINL
jgi:hypothetical protein